MKDFKAAQTELSAKFKALLSTSLGNCAGHTPVKPLLHVHNIYIVIEFLKVKNLGILTFL